MWTVLLSPSVTCHSTGCYVYTSLQQTVYQTSNPRRQYHAIRFIRTLQFIWWTRKVECQSDILQWANNLLLLYDSVIRDKRRFLRRNGLLLQEDKPKEIAEWKRVINDYKQKIRRNPARAAELQSKSYAEIKSTPLYIHASALMSCPWTAVPYSHHYTVCLAFW